MSDRNTDAYRPPQYLIGTGLLFWGVLTEHYFLGILAAIVYEAHHFVSLRFVITVAQFKNLWNLSVIGFGAFGLIRFLANPVVKTVGEHFVWIPISFLPIALGQVYATASRIPVSTFFLFPVAKLGSSKKERVALRKEHHKIEEGGIDGGNGIHFGYPFFLLILFATGASNPEGPLFYFVAAALIGKALWYNRDRRASPIPWVMVFAVVVAIGFVGHVQLRLLYKHLETMALSALSDQGFVDPNGTGTRIGNIGQLKLSARVMWRLDRHRGEAPAYLREATFNIYDHGNWIYKGGSRFEALEFDLKDDEMTWYLKPKEEKELSFDITLTGKANMNHDPNQLVLPLPGDTYAIRDLPAGVVGINLLGTVRAIDIPRIVRFDVNRRNAGEAVLDPFPQPNFDLLIPEAERDVIDRVAEELGILGDIDEENTIKRVRSFFLNNFTYSTYLKIRKSAWVKQETPISRFLEVIREGHCEYFATSTVLLLRAAGIPARYSVGYSVPSSYVKKDRYLVRGKHAHAWAQAWVGGRWINVDTTPPDWNRVEENTISWFQPLLDFLSQVEDLFLLWRNYGMDPSVKSKVLVLLIVLTTGMLIYRLQKMGKWKRAGRKMELEKIPERTILGEDSEFYELEEMLGDCAELRRDGDSLQRWWPKVKEKVDPDLHPAIEAALRLHYRLRFDPHGLEIEEREELRNLARASLESLRLATVKVVRD